MYIQHNMAAETANRFLKENTGTKLKCMEKLSSGYKVNRAADDAASLQISEEMRAQIRGLNQGSDNIADGNSFINVADGALSEVHAMLQRMRELCVQAANDTNTATERETIQKEIQQLLKATESIFTDTKFNTVHVFTLDETNRIMTGGSRSYGLLKLLKSDKITQASNLGDIVTFGNAADWVTSGASLPEFTTTTSTYDPATGSKTPTNSTTANSNTIPALTHNGTTYNLQDNWNALLNAASSNGTVTSNGITYTRNGNTLTYTNKNDTLQLTFRSYINGNNGYNYMLQEAVCTTTARTTGNKLSETCVTYNSREGGGASFVEGVSYPAAFIDFSGMGKSYPPSKLVGLGFTSTCSHGCGCYYSVKL